MGGSTWWFTRFKFGYQNTQDKTPTLSYLHPNTLLTILLRMQMSHLIDQRQIVLDHNSIIIICLGLTAAVIDLILDHRPLWKLDKGTLSLEKVTYTWISQIVLETKERYCSSIYLSCLWSSASHSCPLGIIYVTTYPNWSIHSSRLTAFGTAVTPKDQHLVPHRILFRTY